MDLTEFFPDAEPQRKTKQPKFRFRDAIIFENENYVVINKPPFISTLDDRRDASNLLQEARGYVPDAQMCHRLDKQTSGVLVIAKNPEAYRHMSMQFEHRKVKKIYHAVADGIHNFRDTLVNEPILKLEDGTVRISKKEGRPAQTFFNSIRSYRLHTLIECQPVTGRMHQIRVHLSWLGAPITGDETYGGKPFLLSQVKRRFNLKKGTEEAALISRMALHAFALEFEDLDGEKRRVEAPYPKDFQALVRQLDQNS